MKKTILFIAVFIAALHLASSFDKEVLLIECVEQTDGTDTDCEECYYKIYGHHSND
jgi:hypothetical protein